VSNTLVGGIVMRWPRSIRLRYTLRALLAFLTLFALWGGYHANRAIKERRAEAVLVRHGASLQFGPKRSGNSFSGLARFGYEKIVQLVWRERYITHASIFSTLKPDIVEALVALPHLESLWVQPGMLRGIARQLRGEAAIKDAERENAPVDAIERILATHRMLGITLVGLNVSETDLQAIARHESLRDVCLTDTALSEAGLAAIAGLPELTHLRFSHCQVTGEKLASVPGSATLDFIECPDAPVGLEFAAFVGRCHNLKSLTIRYKEIDDEFVARLGPHPSIEALDFRRTRVTDRSIATIAQMPSLVYVVLPRETVSQSAFDRLQRARPTLHVTFY
jgi:hypothetical protein